jgi:hypothetical protein
LAYQVLGEDGAPLDAHFDIDGPTIIFHSRGGTKGKDARNVDYTRALRLLLQRLADAGHVVQRAWVDSNRVQSIPIDQRVILDAADSALSPEEKVSRMGSRMQAIGRDAGSQSDHGNATKRIRLRVAGDVPASNLVSVLCAVPTDRNFRSTERLPATELEKVTAEHVFAAVEELRSGATHSFGSSIDYDVLLEDGTRLPPKAVFGIAASKALGFEVGPRHFTAGLGSPCFRILESAGYEIVAKGGSSAIPTEPIETDAEWREGTPRLRTHLRRERSASLREAKKAEFRRTHGGRLFCERCGEDPVEKYGTTDAEACIEVHHARVQVADMSEGHATRLEDLQCLCANCHRLTHREMKNAANDGVAAALRTF